MPFRYRILIACSLGFLLGLLLFVLLVMASLFRQPPGFSWYILFWFLGTSVLIWEAGVRLERGIARRVSPRQHFWWSLVLQVCAQFLVGVAIFDGTYLLIKQAENSFLGAQDPIAFPHLVSATLLGSLLSAVLAFASTAIRVAVLWKDAAVRAQQLEKEKVAAHYLALKHQLSPHFLFNNLNTLHALIHESSELAGSFTLHMAETYRYILKSVEEEVVTIKEECRMLTAYTFLLKQRYGEGLHFQMDLPEAIGAFFTVPLALHTLVENAVKHNVIAPSKPISIQITTEDDTWLKIANNRQFKEGLQESTGIGLANLKARYALLSEAPVRVDAGADRFEVRLPILRVERL